MNKVRMSSRISLRTSPNHSPPSSSSTLSYLGRSYSDFYSDDVDDLDDDDDQSYDYFDWDELSVKQERNPVAYVLTHEAYCFDVTRFAERLVDATIQEAQNVLTRSPQPYSIAEITCSHDDKLNMENPEGTLLGMTHEGRLSSSDNFSFNMDHNWPRISEFNIKLGLEKLEDYVNTWELSQDWMFCVEFLGFECEDSSNVFVYEVEWSKPTPEYPIPQSTASVYFALEVFKIVPYNYDRSIQVTYVFEGSNVIHYPGKIDFQEKWLEDIIAIKLKFFKRFTFAVSNVVFGFSERTSLPRDRPVLFILEPSTEK